MAKLQKTRNSFKRITYHERVTIENRYCIDKRSISSISKELDRPVSAISREIGGKPRIGRGKYNADVRQNEVEWKRSKQGRRSKFVNENLKKYVYEKMKLGWSPEQIYLRLKIENPNDDDMNISYEAIYQHVYSQIYRGGNGKVKDGCVDLRVYLARRHTRRQTKGFRKAQKLERDTKLPSIEIRPREALERKVLGHWEGDTIVCRENDERIKSLNERVSGVVFFGKTRNGTAEACNEVVVERLKNIPSPFLKSLTQDRGKENYGFEIVERTLGLSCFFAHSYCSYERGSNENTNGLFRRYFPKGTDFGKITDQEISKVEYLINSRPRKRLGGLTPYEVFYQITGVALDS